MTDESSADRRTALAGWIALGALMAGSVGAVMGAMRCGRAASRRHTRAMPPNDVDPATLTPPHGDKLSRAL